MGLLTALRIKDFDARLVTWNGVQNCTHVVHRVEDAQGVFFDCPCGSGHMIGIWFARPDVLPPAGEGAPPNEKRWFHTGTSLDNLSLSPSISLPCWHGYITDGRVLNA